MPANRIHKGEVALLLAILFLASFLTFYPHLNYPYLLHVDEWFHVATAKMIASNQKIDWYSGKPFELGMERAWHLTLAVLQKLLNLSITQWIYIPAIMHALAVLSTFFFVKNLFGKKEAFISAFLIALIPSNVTIGGPVFLVPINLSLIFIPLALTFAFELVELKPFYNYLALFLIATYLLYAHPPTAIALLTILGFYFLLNLFSKDKRSKRKARALLATILLSILISLPNYLPEIQKKGIESIKFDFWVYLKEIPFVYGFIPTVFFVFGFYLLTRTRSKENWSLLLASLFLIFNIFLFARFGLSWLIPYQRTYVPLFFLMSTIASFGYAKLLDAKKPYGTILLLVFLAVTAFFAIERNIATPYYHLIDEKDYQSFLWIKENTSNDAIVLLDPWKARAFAAIAERRVYAVMPFGPSEEELKLVENARKFLAQNCTNTSFLIDNNISLVYSTEKCNNSMLIAVKENIYKVKFS